MGCSYVSRYGVTTETAYGKKIVNGAIGHLACMYCSPEKKDLQIKNCPKYAMRSTINSYLCRC